jgi:Asp-tRNA(Asn)/Glu-tRNA(Gln) amidotransferase A subunit family amidase
VNGRDRPSATFGAVQIEAPSDLPAAPAPDEPVTAAPGPAGARAERAPVPPGTPATSDPAARDAATADLTARLARDAARRRPVAEGGAWVRECPDAVTAAGPGGRPAGPLDRVVVAVKDLVAVAGLPLGAGSRVRADAPPEPADAPVVAALRRAGAVVAGTVALHELAFGVTGINDEVGFPPLPRGRRDPGDPARIPGGSSSGSAVAVADGTCDLAVGTDTGGSVRIPAALCGVVGFKPAAPYPLAGVLPLAPTLDQVGFLAPSVAGVAAAHTAVTGEPPPPDRPRAGLRLGVEAGALAAADDPVATAVDAALRRLAAAGCELVDVAGWPDRSEILDVSTTIMFAEAAAVHRALLAGPAAALVGAPVAERFRVGAAIAEADYRRARSAGAGLAAQVRRALGAVDAVVGPTVPVVAPAVEAARTDDALPRRLVAETRLANVARLPVLTVPVPTDGLPVGLQVTAASDAAALAVGAAVAGALA